MDVVPRVLGFLAAFAVLGTALNLIHRLHKKKPEVNIRKINSKLRNEVTQLNESLFELHKPSGKPSLQVLFFHGFQLGSYEEAYLSTWKSLDGTCIWPKTWLVEEFPNAHILSIAYNSSLTKSKEHGSVDLYIIGENIMNDLLEAKIGQDRRCPVVLVGHSFGGLVLKELCLHAHKKSGNSSKHKRFLENVKGLFFYSTPHIGINLEKFTSLFESKSPLLKNMKLLSTSTARLNDEFEEVRRNYEDWHIAGVGENRPTKWDQSPAFLVVEEASSRYGDFNIVPDANHITITRPEKKISTNFNALSRLIHKVCNIAKVSSASHQTQGLPYFSSGLEKRGKDVKKELRRATTQAPNQATVFGIVGMGGIGKTTIAKQIFNEISLDFEYTCFVENVKGIPTHALNKLLLRNFYQDGIQLKRDEMQWSHLKDKKSLIVMDDVDSVDCLKLLPKLSDFGGDSHLIITTRDRDVLETYPGYHFYDVDFLDVDEAKELLCEHVFGSSKIPKHLIESDPSLEHCVDKLLEKCQGLPLTLEVMGRFLRPHYNNTRFWNETIRKLGEARTITGNQGDIVFASLKISYDHLEKDEQEMFIEAGTCFFKTPLEEALAAWSTPAGSAEFTWESLIRRSLVKVVPTSKWDDTTSEDVEYMEIWVHEHLRDLAKKVSDSHEVSAYDEDAFKGLNLHDGILVEADQDKTVSFWFKALPPKMENRRGLDPNMMRIEPLLNFNEETRTLQLESLEHWENLKYLYLHNLMPKGLIKNFPRNVSLLQWTLSYKLGYPQLPGISWEEMIDLGVLQLEGWKIPTEFLEALGNLRNLRILYLGDLIDLDPLPKEIGNLSFLERLDLRSLYSLSTLPDSFGDLGALKHLTIRDLEVSELPESFGNLCSLVTLVISDCEKLRSLPESFGHLPCLKKLFIMSCYGLETLPASFGELHSLETLEISDCKRLASLSDSFGHLSYLKGLSIRDCHSLERLPESFGLLAGLKDLKSDFCSNLRRLLPDNFGN